MQICLSLKQFPAPGAHYFELHFWSCLFLVVWDAGRLGSWPLTFVCHHRWFYLFFNHQTSPVLHKALLLVYFWEVRIFLVLTTISGKIDLFLKRGALETWGSMKKGAFIGLFPTLVPDMTFSSQLDNMNLSEALNNFWVCIAGKSH